MLVGGGGVLLGLVMLADFVVVSRLVVMVCSRTMVGRSLVMMLRGGMFAFVCHDRSPGWNLGGPTVMLEDNVVEPHLPACIRKACATTRGDVTPE
jgi:hypothetical protein